MIKDEMIKCEKIIRGPQSEKNSDHFNEESNSSSAAKKNNENKDDQEEGDKEMSSGKAKQPKGEGEEE